MLNTFVMINAYIVHLNMKKKNKYLVVHIIYVSKTVKKMIGYNMDKNVLIIAQKDMLLMMMASVIRYVQINTINQIMKKMKYVLMNAQ
jgi:hypothetical protein